ncbi:hypothetical protein D3C81_1302780 [compost metagenome]
MRRPNGRWRLLYKRITLDRIQFGHVAAQILGKFRRNFPRIFHGQGRAPYRHRPLDGALLMHYAECTIGAIHITDQAGHQHLMLRRG